MLVTCSTEAQVINWIIYLIVVIAELKVLAWYYSFNSNKFQRIKRLPILYFYVDLWKNNSIAQESLLVDKLKHAEDAALPATNLLEAKILVNSAILDVAKGARIVHINTKDHFLVTLIRIPECISMRYKWIPKETREDINYILK